ncbi:Prenyltransferase and squalene oxidase repeat protein [Aquisphaera giovannonii]|uniref:Geranylgeranyl transferase type II subunit beta n=1 Tax=Aquisphaera giovannonii TaxID=406548 RepID=A0A5B9W1A4_9BACT|nr:family 16 glycoside hydrolase [Aquisphaera giovannonii]QEH34366.1 Prenyltransferase and squalene oxidase repeat protein [Aquisphaera giovannonii]
MRRSAWGMVLALAGLAAWGLEARGQSVADFAQTAAYLAAQQNADGGFAPAPGQASTLGATSTTIRTLGFVGGSAPDVAGCIKFVKSCRVPGKGFSQTPGGEPEVVVTAIGLMAAKALDIVDEAMVEDSVALFGSQAKSFEDVRMAIAGLEAVEADSPDFPKWGQLIEEMREPDGSFGEGPSKAFATGGAAASILRMHLPLEKKEAVVAAIKAGQRPEGAWSKDDGPPDLASSYRVMRAMYMMKEKPDVEKLFAFIARCRNADGSYSGTPGGAPGLGTTYNAAIILYWLRLLADKPPALESSTFAPLFNGSDTAGWEGNTALWSAHDGILVGKSPGLDHNEFLAHRERQGDFILSLWFRLVEGKGNTGVQFRSVRVPGTEMSGYQADIGEGYWGSLYDESRRNKTLVNPTPEALKPLKKEGWNHYVVYAMGDRITLYLNGSPTAVYREPESEIAREGLIAVQLHAGAPMEVHFKDLLVRPLP